MDISFSHTTIPVYRELTRPVKRIQESLESVVPDSDEDIGRIVSVSTELFLRSKDLSSRGVNVTGEVDAVLLYITEDEKSLSSVRLRKSFEMDFELGESPSELLTQIRLSLCHAETRVLNPRKVSVTVELLGELSCFQQGELRLETLLPENAASVLHGRMESAETSVVNAVCEKTFALSEQFRFPEGKPQPERLIAERVFFSVDEIQPVSSRVVVKGTATVELCYLSAEADYPLRVRFSTPFSQIVDTGAESCLCASCCVELTGAYYDLVDTISGEKALDVELHALLELVSRDVRELSYLSDVYSNQMPVVCSYQTAALSLVSPAQRVRLVGEGEIALAEDCADVLAVLPSVSRLILTESGLESAVCLDIVYRSGSGCLAAMRRLLELEKRSLPQGSRLYAGRLDSMDFRPTDGVLHCRVSLEAEYQTVVLREITDVCAVTLQEDAPYTPESFPTLTLVRRGEGELWELAKRYHSSVEGILALNSTENGLRQGALLIPRED